MSDGRDHADSRYENIIDWLKKDPVCNIDETIKDDTMVSIINTSYFEDFKIGVYVYKNDVGRVEIVSSPRLLAQDGKILQNADDKIVNDFQTQLTKDLLKNRCILFIANKQGGKLNWTHIDISIIF